MVRHRKSLAHQRIRKVVLNLRVTWFETLKKSKTLLGDNQLLSARTSLFLQAAWASTNCHLLPKTHILLLVLHIYQQCNYVALWKSHFLFVKKYFVKQCGKQHNQTSFACSVSWHCLLHETTSIFPHQLSDVFLSVHTGIRIKFITTDKREITESRHGKCFFLNPALPNPSALTNFKGLWIKCIVNNPRWEPTKLLVVHWSKNCSVIIYSPLKTDNNMTESIKTATQRVLVWYMLQFIRVSPSWRKWLVEVVSGLTYFSNASRCNWVYGTQTQKKIYIIMNICQFSISNMLLLLFFQTSSRSRHSWCLGCYFTWQKLGRLSFSCRTVYKGTCLNQDV